MTKSLKLTLLLTFSLSLIIIIFYIFTKNDTKKKYAINFLKNGINIKLDKVYLTQEKDNKKEWELDSDSIEVNQKNNTTILTNVKIKAFPKKNNSFIISAKKGKIINNSKNFEMSGNVSLQNNDYTILTQRLKWKSSTNEIYTDDYIKIKGKLFTISGVDLKLKIEKGYLKINKNVQAEFHTDSKSKKL